MRRVLTDRGRFVVCCIGGGSLMACGGFFFDKFAARLAIVVFGN